MKVEMSKEISSKEKAIYEAVLELFKEGADLSALTVAEITQKAGIGKGTAYEYFSEKEEMIAKSVCYHVRQFCNDLYVYICQEKTLYDKLEIMMKKMEVEIGETNCMLRFIHAMTDNSMIGKKMKEMDDMGLLHDIPVVDVLNRIILEEWHGKGMIPEKKQEFLVMSLFSKILCYAMYLQRSHLHEEEENVYMRKQICQSICREIKAVLYEVA